MPLPSAPPGVTVLMGAAPEEAWSSSLTDEPQPARVNTAALKAVTNKVREKFMTGSPKSVNRTAKKWGGKVSDEEAAHAAPRLVRARQLGWWPDAP